MSFYSKRIFRLFAVVTLLSGLAFADRERDKEKEKGGEKGRPAASASAEGAKHEDKKDDAKKDDEDDDDGPADGGKASGRRTPAQLNFRKEVWERREKAIEQRVHKGGKKMTEAEREAVKKHWLTIGRGLRIRGLAQEDKNDAAVKRVDALLEKKEKSFDAFLDKVEAKADGGAK